MFFVCYPESGNVKVFSENGVFLYNISPPECGDGHLSCPVGLAIDRFNNLVICDQHKARLQIFNTGPCSVALSSSG